MKPRAKALAWLIAVFLIGAGLGSIATVSVARSGILPGLIGQTQQEGSSRKSSREGFAERLIHELNLDSTQEARVRAILEDSREKLKELYQSRRQRHNEIRKQAIDEIRAILNPPQQERLDAFLQRLSQNHRERSGKKEETREND